MSANANGWHGVPIKTTILKNSEDKTERWSEESDAEWRPRAPVPFGLLRKWLFTLLQKLAGLAARLRFRASRRAIFALQRIRRHSVNRP